MQSASLRTLRKGKASFESECSRRVSMSCMEAVLSPRLTRTKTSRESSRLLAKWQKRCPNRNKFGAPDSGSNKPIISVFHETPSAMRTVIIPAKAGIQYFQDHLDAPVSEYGAGSSSSA